MRPLFATAVAACVVARVTGASTARAQQWNDEQTMALVDRAIARRAAQLADTGLVNYRAVAHGYLTFLAQLGEGFPDPPKVVRTDELALEVYWRAPNQSKQRIVGRRDTLLLPTDIAYHRDHLAIIQNNFPSIIRLGDGDEVRDVPHPLSVQGRAAYDFAVTDSQTIRTSDHTYAVIEVKVRPKDARLERAVGAVYIDRATASVVRMAFSFTRTALKDPLLEDVSVILENGLVSGRFWLPRRQEIEIRRTDSWMDFPARGIIRGRWEICCVETNASLPPELFAGPEIVAVPPLQQRQYQFKGSIVETLPEDVRLSEADDIRGVQEEARTLVRAEALERLRVTSPSAHAVSEVIRFDRVEGLAIGGGITRQLGDGFAATARARFGTASHAAAGEGAFSWRNATGTGVSLTGRDDFREAGDEPEVSGLRNSIAAQEFGSDFTDYYRSRGATLAWDVGAAFGTRWRVSIGGDREDSLSVHAHPVTGAFARALPADPLTAWTAAIEGFHADGAGPLGSTLRAATTLSVSHVQFDGSRGGDWLGRLSIVANAERAFGADRLVLHTTAAVVAGPAVPTQDLVFFGGPVTGPGLDYHQLQGTVGWSQRVEWQHTAAQLPLPLGRFGKLPTALVLAPYLQGIWIGGETRPGGATGWYPAAGLGVLTLFNLLRFDVARGLRDGRWTFGVDLSREFWRIL